MALSAAAVTASVVFCLTDDGVTLNGVAHSKGVLKDFLLKFNLVIEIITIRLIYLRYMI